MTREMVQTETELPTVEEVRTLLAGKQYFELLEEETEDEAERRTR